MPFSPYQEIRDPIHVFVRLDDDELKVLDSAPVQRLRHIHQLAMSYLVYPGATHRRFEHSLGVMELAGRVFDVVTHEANVIDPVRATVGNQLLKPDERLYWRKALRMAALCHDIGHLPFSHAAEKAMLPEGVSHEHISAEIILGDEMGPIWGSMKPPLNPIDVAKLAVGEEKMGLIRPGERFSVWENLMAEIISSDTLGVDRMDYLLRDSHHAGVAYGRFDHHRLVDTMRLLPTYRESGDLTLGITEGGIHTAEALLLARYSMFMQVYFHRTRVAYDCLLADFLREWLPFGKFSTEYEDFQWMTDVKILYAISEARLETNSSRGVTAGRILDRGHFRQLYKENPDEWRGLDHRSEQEPARLIFDGFVRDFGAENGRHVAVTQKESDLHFPVVDSNYKVVSSNTISDSLHRIPVARFAYVLVAPEFVERAREWLANEKDDILSQTEKSE